MDAVRTPYGQRGGALSGWHPVDLSAEMLSQLVERVGINSGAVDDVIFGCTTQVGAQACNIARRAVLAAGWPEQRTGGYGRPSSCILSAGGALGGARL